MDLLVFIGNYLSDHEKNIKNLHLVIQLVNAARIPPAGQADQYEWARLAGSILMRIALDQEI